MVREATDERKNCGASNLDNKDTHIEDISTAWQIGDWQPCLPRAALYRAQKSPTLENIYLAQKIQNAIKGMDSTSVQSLSQLLVESHEKTQWSKAAIRMLCAQLQLGNKDMAHECVSQFLRGECTLLRSRSITRFPTALSFLCKHYPEKLSTRQTKLSHSSITFLKHIDIVDEMFLQALVNQQQKAAQKKLRVAVVGNGPSILEGEHRQYIDSHDIVIRFNNCVLNDTYKHHTGEKTSLHIISPNLAKRAPTKGMVALAISGINIFHGESGYWQYLANLPPRVKLAVFDQKIWYQLVKELNAPPSAGLLTLASLAILPNVRISTFGFSHNAKNTPMSAITGGKSIGHSAIRNHYGDNSPASTRHDWGMESRLISRLCSSCIHH